MLRFEWMLSSLLYEVLILIVSDARVQLEKAEIDEDHLDNKEFYQKQTFISDLKIRQ